MNGRVRSTGGTTVHCVGLAKRDLFRRKKRSVVEFTHQQMHLY